MFAVEKQLRAAIKFLDGERRRRKDPSTDSEGGEEKRPKVRRQDARTLVIRLT